MTITTEALRLARRREPIEAALAMARNAACWPVRVHRARLILRQLNGLAEHELRDIGLTRLDLAAVRALPLDADPSRVLRRRVEERRGRR